jgi:tyrosyl-tRNA synthetase
MPLIVGTDGVEKMSKSYNNYIGISEAPKEIYGKTLSIPDKIIYNYFELATDVSNERLKEIRSQLNDDKFNPRDIKRELARTLVSMYHSKEAAIEAEAEFDRIFISKEIPDDIPEYKFNKEISEIGILDLLVEVKFAPTKAEARRLVIQGGVSIDGEKVQSISEVIKIKGEKILKVGKRKFIKLK